MSAVTWVRKPQPLKSSETILPRLNSKRTSTTLSKNYRGIWHTLAYTPILHGQKSAQAHTEVRENSCKIIGMGYHKAEVNQHIRVVIVLQIPSRMSWFGQSKAKAPKLSSVSISSKPFCPGLAESWSSLLRQPCPSMLAATTYNLQKLHSPRTYSKRPGTISFVLNLCHCEELCCFSLFFYH